MWKLFKNEKIHLSDGRVPSSLVAHILALRHRKYELYAPMKMQTKKTSSWQRDKCDSSSEVFFQVKKTFFVIVFGRSVLDCADCYRKSGGVAISQLVKFNLQDLQLMNNIEENIARASSFKSTLDVNNQTVDAE